MADLVVARKLSQGCVTAMSGVETHQLAGLSQDRLCNPHFFRLFLGPSPPYINFFLSVCLEQWVWSNKLKFEQYNETFLDFFQTKVEDILVLDLVSII